MGADQPNWVEITTLVCVVITLLVTLYRLLKRVEPTVICRLISAERVEHPDLYELTISPIPGWEGTLTRISGEDVVLALPEYGRDEMNERVLLPAARYADAVVLDFPLYAWDENLRRIHLRASRSSSRSHVRRSVKLEIRMTSPRMCRIAKKANASVVT